MSKVLKVVFDQGHGENYTVDIPKRLKDCLNESQSVCCSSEIGSTGNSSKHQTMISEAQSQSFLPVCEESITPEKIFDCTYIPEIMKFREKEQKSIETFIKNCIQKTQSTRCMLVTGMPGTGKTLLLTKILNQYKILQQQKNLASQAENFEVYSFNGMNYNTQDHFLSDLYLALMKQKHQLKNVNILIKQLSEHLAANAKKQIIIMVDEFDNLFKNTGKSQKNIFEIFSLISNQNFSLVGISNTMEMLYELSQTYNIKLPEIENLVFQPYSNQQMIEILQDRIKEAQLIHSQSLQFCKLAPVCEDQTELFNINALKLCAGKLYIQKGGDIRSLLETCKLALIRQKLAQFGKKSLLNPEEEEVETTTAETKQLTINSDDDTRSTYNASQSTRKSITISQMNEILQEQSTQNIKINAMSSFSTELQILLVSFYIISSLQKEIIYLKKDKIYTKYNEICSAIMHNRTSIDQLNENLQVLNSYKIIEIRNSNTKKKKTG